MAYAELTEGKIKIDTAWNEKELITQIPGSTYRSNTWWLPLSWASCQALRGTFRDRLAVGSGLAEWARDEHTVRIKPSLELREKYSEEDARKIYDVDNLTGPTLKPFQALGLEWMTVSGSGLLGDEMGSGKTVQTLSFLDRKEDALPALVIVPNSVKYHWARLARTWIPRATPYVITGTAAQRRKLLLAASMDPYALVIVNLEALRSLTRLAPYGSVRLRRCKECDPHHGDEIKPASCDAHEKILNTMTFASVVLDEAHRSKDPKSKQTRAVWQVMHQAGVKYRWALTGTPIAQHPGDLWSVMYGVQPDEYPSKTKWIERYTLADWNPFGGMDIVGLNPQTREEFYRIFDPRFRRMLKEITLPQLPDVVREIRSCDLTPAMRKSYDALYEGLATRLPDGEMLVAWNDMTKQQPLQQMACGGIEIVKPDPDNILTWKFKLKEPSPKLDVLEEMLDDLGYTYGTGPAVVIAAEHKQLIDLAAARLAKRMIPHALITGDISPERRDTALEMLRNGEIRILLFTIKAGGVGLDMTAADTMIFLQQPWSMVERLQAEGRVHRIGSEQHESIRVIDVITRGTVEETQVERVHEKLARLEEITRDKARLLETREAPAYDLDAAEQSIMSQTVLDPERPGDDGDDAPAEVVAGYLHDLQQAVGDPGTVLDHIKEDCTLCDHLGPCDPVCPCSKPSPIKAESPSEEIVQEHQYTDPSGIVWVHPGPAETCSAPDCTEPSPAAVSMATEAEWAQAKADLGAEVDVYPLLKISASKLRDWTRCRRKWWLTWFRNLQAEEDLLGIRAIGTRVHEALAGWYVPGNQVDPRDGLEAAIKKDWGRLTLGITDQDRLQQIADTWEKAVTLERAMIEGYMQWLEETGSDSGLHFVASETDMSKDIHIFDHDGAGLTVRAMGKLDARAVREIDGARVFIDHKTVGDLTRPLKTITMNPQMLMYHLLEWLSTEEGDRRCDGALYNMLRRVKRTAAAKPPFYARESVRHNQVQLESFRKQLLAAARDMAMVEKQLDAGEDPANVVYPTPGEDCSWSCDFYLVCPLFDDGSRAEDMISSVYRDGNPWERYDRVPTIGEETD